MPEAPVEEWEPAEAAHDTRPTIDIPEPPATTPIPTITATQYAEAFAPDAPVPEWNPEQNDSGLGVDTHGTIVHRLCERTPDRDDWPAIIARLAAASDETSTDADVESIVTHTERCLAFRDDLEANLAAQSTHDELSVTADLDTARLTGAIDRLVVTPEAYHVVDYKTGRLGGRSIDALADVYWPQLHVYAAALHQSDPSRTIDLTLFFADVNDHRHGSLDPGSVESLIDDLHQNVREEFRPTSG